MISTAQQRRLVDSLPPEDGTARSEDEEECGEGAATDAEETGTDGQFVLDEDEPQKFSQGEMHDLVRDLTLSKDTAELLASRLKGKCLFKKDVRITQFSEKGMRL